MASRYHQYYDRIYAGKDYAAEVAAVLRISLDLTGAAPKRVLDVGCGTGSHALLLASAGCDVVGLDLDTDAIAVACGKCVALPPPVPRFLCQDVAALADDGFDLAISMFNVINYIDCSRALSRFLEAIIQRLAPGGVYIFDCWNGLAALLDPPRDKEMELAAGDERIKVATRPTLDRMRQSVHMTNQVTITRSNGGTESFDYNYTSTLWTPWHLRQVLTQAGFGVVNICRLMEPDKQADEQDWKIMFICRR